MNIPPKRSEMGPHPQRNPLAWIGEDTMNIPATRPVRDGMFSGGGEDGPLTALKAPANAPQEQ